MQGNIKCSKPDEDTKSPTSPPHIQIHIEIQNLDDVINSLENLLSKIGCPIEEGSISENSEAPALAQFLQNSSGEIRRKYNRMIDLIDQINGTLFI